MKIFLAGASGAIGRLLVPGAAWVPLYAQLVGAPPPPVKRIAEPWERGESNAKARALGWTPTPPGARGSRRRWPDGPRVY